jgi:hypothetical protein
MNIGSALDVISAFNTVVTGQKNAESIAGIITGSKSVQSALKQLDEDIVKGFENVVKA